MPRRSDCIDCGVAIEQKQHGRGLLRCPECFTKDAQASRAGTAKRFCPCGKRSSRGRSYCDDCRALRANPPHRPKRNCATCQTLFDPVSRVHKYCGPPCFPKRNQPWANKKLNLTPEQLRLRNSPEYLKARQQVLSEETVCWICEQDIDPAIKFPSPWSASIDHIIPVVEEGCTNDRSNLRAAHLRCNTRRGNEDRRKRNAALREAARGGFVL